MYPHSKTGYCSENTTRSVVAGILHIDRHEERMGDRSVKVSITGQTQPREHPALFRPVEVAVARPRMSCGGDAGPAAEDHLADHELAVVLPQRAARGAIARVGAVGALRPLPGHAVHLLEQILADGKFPFRLAG